MMIGGSEANFAVFVDTSGKVIAGVSDNNVIVSDGLSLLIEQKRGDLRFVEYENGAIQAIDTKGDMTVPKGALYSDEFIDKCLQQQRADMTVAEDQKEDDVIIVDTTHDEKEVTAADDTVVIDVTADKVDEKSADDVATETASD